MSDFPHVQILMATYNGEKFLREQLDSILAQDYPDWEILARDDGSKDTTTDILKGYQTNHPNRIKIVNDNEGNLGGYTQNFERLANLSTADVIAFADQDDVWFPQKVARSVEAIRKIEQKSRGEKPALVHHDFILVDAERNLIVESYDRSNKCSRSNPTTKRMPFAADVHGFSMTANRALLSLALPFPRLVQGHDSVLGCVAQDVGAIEFIPENLALYRLHGNNTSVCVPLHKRALNKIFHESSFGTITADLKAVFAEVHSNFDKKCLASGDYLQAYRAHLSVERIAELEKLANARNLGTIDRKMLAYRHTGPSMLKGAVAALIL